MRIRDSVKVGFNSLKILPEALNSLLIIEVFTLIVFCYLDRNGIKSQISANPLITQLKSMDACHNKSRRPELKVKYIFYSKIGNILSWY
jgi:hypothetical protein